MAERIQYLLSQAEELGIGERSFSISQMQPAIDDGYEGFIFKDQQGLVYRAQKPDHIILPPMEQPLVGGGDSVYQGLFGEEAKSYADNWPWLHAKAAALLSN